MINYLFALVLGGTILGVSFFTGDLFNRVSKLIPAPVATYAPIATSIPFDQPTASPKKIVKAVPKPVVQTPQPITQGRCKLDIDKYVMVSTQEECNRQVRQYLDTKYPLQPITTPKIYPLCIIYYPATKTTQTYSTFDTEYCNLIKAQVASNANTGGYVIPDIAGPAGQAMMDGVNSIITNTQIGPSVPLGSTPIPCSALTGYEGSLSGTCN